MRKRINKVLAYVLSFVMLLSCVPADTVFAKGGGAAKAIQKANARKSVVSDSGMAFDLSWDANSPYVNGDTFRYKTSSDTTANATMKVSYSSKKVREEGYEAGELIITVDGLKSIYRGGTPSAEIAADKASDKNKVRDWSYTYNSKTDVYTFTNNRKVQPNAMLSGYFELIFKMDARSCKDLNSKDITAKFLLPDEDEIVSDPLTFVADTTIDRYSVNINAEKLYNTQGLNISNPQDYFWRKYPLNYTVYKNSRGLKGSEQFYVTVPEGTIVLNHAGAVEDNVYKVNIPKTGSYIYVLYPKDKFELQSVTVGLEAKGIYNEGLDGVGKEELVSLAKDSVTIKLPGFSDFDFLYPPKPPESTKPPSEPDYSLYPYKKSSYSSSNGGIFGANIFGEDVVTGTTDTWHLGTNVAVRSSEEPVSIQFVDDLQCIMLNSGKYRQLTSKDYELESVEIPSNSSIRNVNGLPITQDKYQVLIYAVQNDATIKEDNSTLVYDGYITNRYNLIQLPKGTTAISIRINNIDDIISKIDFPVKTRYFVDNSNEDINLSTGRLRNVSFFKYYDKDGNWLNNDIKASSYLDDSGLQLAKRDQDLYGAYLERDYGQITFYGREAFRSNYVATTRLNSFVLKDNKFVSNLTFGTDIDVISGENKAGKFSIYTILPEGMRINENILSKEELWDIMSIRGLGDQDLSDYADVEYEKNYKGSGRTYIGVHFDISELSPGIGKISVQASLDVAVEKNWYRKNGGTFTVRSVAMIDDHMGFKETYKSRDNGSWNTEHIWSDIDGDENTSEWLAHDYDYKSITYANSSQFEMNKWIESQYTDGMIQLPEIADIGYGDNYKYTTRIINGVSKSKDIVLIDHLEDGPNSEWKGTFVSVDTSDAEKLGLKPTIWYSEKSDAGDLGSDEWVKELEPSKVKSVAISLEGMFEAGKIFDIGIHMKAPTDKTLKDKVTENNYKVGFTMYDLVSGDETKVDNLVSNYVQGRLIPGLKNITIVKEDEVDGSKLAGAEFSLINKETGEIIKATTSNSKGYATFTRIPQYCTYILRETKAPQGYEKIDDMEVSIEDTAKKITVKDPRKKGTLQIEKRSSVDRDALLEGAELTVTKDGFEKKVTTDKDGKAVLEGLEWGTYTITETKAPKGYEINPTPVTVTINAKNVSAVVKANVFDPQQPVTLELLKRETLVDGTETETPVMGAGFRLYRVNGNEEEELGTYITDMDGQIFIEDTLPYGEYIWREVRVPTGYQMDSQQHRFFLTPDHQKASVTAYNQRKPGSLNLVKQSDLGTPVVHAEFTLYDSAKQPLETYETDESGMLTIRGLEWGDYFIKETKAPSGFILDEEWHPFHIDGKNLTAKQTLVNETKKGSVRLNKTDESGMNHLSGAVYALYKKDGTLLKENLTTDETGSLLVEGLEWGSYYFLETKAPVGFGLSPETVRFSINASNADALQELTVTDPAESKVIAVTKRIKVSDINFANGNPTFLFRMTGTDVNGEEQTYYRMVAFDKAYVEANVDEDGYVSQTVTFSGMLAGHYTVSEEETSRYVLENIDQLVNGERKEDTAVFDLVSNDEGSVRFTNKNYEAQDYSHTDRAANNVKEQRKLTAILAKWNGEYVLESGILIDRSLLEVTAFYDDGTEKVLEDTDYRLSTETVPYQSGEYQVDVSYTEGGVTKTDHFEFFIDLVVKVREITGRFLKPNATPGMALTPDLFEVIAEYTDGSTRILESKNDELANVTTVTSPNWPNNYNASMTEDKDYWVVEKPGAEQLFLTFDPTSDLESTNYDWIKLYDRDGMDITRTVTGSDKIGGRNFGSTWDGKVFTIPGDYVKLAMRSDSSGQYKGFSADIFTDVKDAEYTINPTKAPAEDGDFEVTITMPIEGRPEAEWPTTTVTVTVKSPPDVKYAVTIYGIQQDDYEGDGGRKAGLTFGPATGADYTNSYKSHTPSEGQMCIHDMTWEEIIAQSKKDPTVFQECLENGCTHSVELKLNSKLKSSTYPNMMGDGAAILYNSINNNYRRWNANSDDTVAGNYRNTGGWPASKIRATLNGYDEETDSILVHPDTTTGYAGSQYLLNRNESLFSCFPAELQSGIVPKVVKSDTVYNDKIGNNKTTYDSLWLYSTIELYSGSSSYLRPNESSLYERQSLNNVTISNYDLMVGFNENGASDYFWLRSVSPNGYSDACGVNNGGSVYGHGVNNSYDGLAPGFCLK